MINIYGYDNLVKIDSGLTRLSNTSINIHGNNCTIFIGAGCNLNNCRLYIEDNDGIIELKRHVTITDYTELAVLEGKKIIVGEDCLFSKNIFFRTGDSHSIIDQSTGKRINPSEDITIGDHVWICQDVRILKGVSVGENSIVAMGSLLTKNIFPSHSIIGGIGGKVLKTGIEWSPQSL